MNTVKLKIFASTFLLIFFYFPKNLNGFINTCDGKHCSEKGRSNYQKFERSPLERENRMVNVRDRVSAERLVNNRRIVDSDSRISDYLESGRSFNFPRLVERTRQSRVCEARRDLSHRNNVRKETRVRSRSVEEIRYTREGDRVILSRGNREGKGQDNLKNRNTQIRDHNSRVENLNRNDQGKRVVRIQERETRIENRNIRSIRNNQNIKTQDRDINVEDRLIRSTRIVNRGTRLQERDTRVENRGLRLMKDYPNSRIVTRERDTRNIRSKRNNQNTRAVSRDIRVDDRLTRDQNTRQLNRASSIQRQDIKVEDHNIRLTRQDQGRFEERNIRLVMDNQNTRVLDREVRAHNRDVGLSGSKIRTTRDNENIRLANRERRVQSRDSQIERRSIRANRDNENRFSRVINNRNEIKSDRTITEQDRTERRHSTIADRNIKLNLRDEERNVRVTDEQNPVKRNTGVQSRSVESRESKHENRDTRDVREVVSRIENLENRSRASKTRVIPKDLQASTFRRDVTQTQRTNERNVRIIGREVRDTNRRFTKRNVDINNNRQIRERNENVGDRNRRISNRDSLIREVDVTLGGYYKKTTDITQWSHILTTTFGVLLLAQIITSSNTKKFGIPKISHFLHEIKEKIY